VAEALGAEILSVDSMKVYRGMDIGTAKPTAEARARVPHHGLDLAGPSESFSVARFVEAAEAAIAETSARGKSVLAVVGTPLYWRALVEGLFEGVSADPGLRARLEERARREGGVALHAELGKVDPAAAARLHPNDVRRVIRALEVHATTGSRISDLQRQWGRSRRPDPPPMAGIRWTRPALDARIARRVEEMFAAGLADEVRRIAESPGGFGPQAARALGYRELLGTRPVARDSPATRRLIALHTRQFAKRQMTWFRRVPIRWWDVSGESDLRAVADGMARSFAP
ncbi:MAG: tRNA (adenosine(37)-N6)-dimethylallyltransferase MiaA, partial [Planctomycetes bacterium]|nr:tRNA (adenosine(37)-N6)-dimethylallyltransferase MiaA [Planctomycetota bacterium]